MSQNVLKRIHESRQPSRQIAPLAPILRQQPVSNKSLPFNHMPSIPPTSSSNASHQSSLPSNHMSLIPPTSSSNASHNNASSSSSVSHLNSTNMPSHKRSKDSLPGAIISVEDHLRSQLRQARAHIGILEAELKKTNVTTLTEMNQSLATKLRISNNKINELEDEILRLSQTERQVLSTERVLNRIMTEDAGFLLKLHEAQMKLLNPNPPRNLQTLSRRLQRKQARMKAYNSQKAVDELLNEPQNDSSSINSPNLQISLTPIINIDLDE